MRCNGFVDSETFRGCAVCGQPESAHKLERGEVPETEPTTPASGAVRIKFSDGTVHTVQILPGETIVVGSNRIVAIEKGRT